MIPEIIKNRLQKNRPMTSITVRMPVDVIESMKIIAQLKGFSGYQALLKSYVSNGIRHDEANFLLNREKKLIEILQKRGISKQLIDEAMCEII